MMSNQSVVGFTAVTNCAHYSSAGLCQKCLNNLYLKIVGSVITCESTCAFSYTSPATSLSVVLDDWFGRTNICVPSESMANVIGDHVSSSTCVITDNTVPHPTCYCKTYVRILYSSDATFTAGYFSNPYTSFLDVTVGLTGATPAAIDYACLRVPTYTSGTSSFYTYMNV